MGSLMAGWDSPVLESNKGRLGRHASFTQEEIDDFWRVKRAVEDEHFKEAVELTKNMAAEKKAENGGKVSSAVMATSQRTNSIDKNLEDMVNFKDWWTKSSWAFLNDPSLKVNEDFKNHHSMRLTRPAVIL